MQNSEMNKNIRKLSSIIFSHLAQERMMSMFTAYFDESGTHDTSPLILIAGWVGKDTQWEKFSVKWKDILKEYDIDMFHMNKWSNKIGRYGQMKESDRQELIRKLLDCILATVEVGFFGSFHMQSYKELIEEGYKDSLGNPYSLCAMICIKSLMQWRESKNLREPIAYILEAGAKGSLEFHAAFNIARKHPQFGGGFTHGPLALWDKKEILPLQAADIIAYECWKDVNNTVAGFPRPMRFPLIQLVDREIKPIGIYYEKDDLRKLIEDLPD
jgi:uncharacterized protein DUF3800